MSTVFDATTMNVEELGAVAVSTPTTITFADAQTVPSVTVNATQPVTAINIEVPGPQGLKNVYVQSNDPAVEFGWGAAQTDFIWIQI